MKLLIFSIFILSFINLNSKDKFSIYFSPSLNFNSHYTDFTNLEGISNYNYSKYDGASNLNPAFSFGFNNKFENNLFGIFSEYSLELSYSNNSVVLNRKELLGNFIKESEYYPIYSEVPLDASLSFLSVNNFIWLDAKLPVDLGFNLNLAYSIGNDFTQVENALGKNEFTFENGLREREQYSGEIPNYNKFNVNVGANVKYDIELTGKYTISPILSYNIALLPLVSDLDWSFSNISLGVRLNYNLIDAPIVAPIPPKDPILPKLKEPEAPKEIELFFYLSAEHKGKGIKDNDTVDIQYNSVRTLEKYSILPIIYFEQNSDELLHSSGNELFELAHNSLIENIINNLKSNPNSKVLINTGKFIAKDKNIVEKRINKIKSFISDENIDLSRVKINYNEVEKLEFRYDELKSEEDKLIFTFDNSNDNLLEFTYFENNSLYLADNYTFNFKVNYSLNDDVISSVSYHYKNKLFQEREFEYTLNKGLDINTLNDELLATSSVTSIRTNTLNDRLLVHINYVLNEEKVISNKIEDENKSRYILGYFNFDDTKFNALDNKIIAVIKSALQSNKKVVIIPMTDNIGDIEYNKILAKKRAEEALKLINSNNSNLSVRYDTNSFFDNDHPYGRTLNRSVIVEIFE